jgi:signal transduction histidine kinase
MRTANWLIASGVAGALLIAALTQQHPPSDLDVLGYVLVVASGLALVGLRAAPVAVLAVAGLCVVGYTAVGLQVPALAFLVAVYGGFRAGRRRATIVAGVVMFLALPPAILAAPSGPPVGEALAHARGVLELAWVVAAGFAGEALRQAERRADEAERTREETARLRASEERLHIARELHDSLTHQISIIKVQSEVAVHLARKRGEQVPDSLLAIQAAGRAATAELRATLATLRQAGDQPAHGLDHLEELLAGVAGIGLRTELTIAGERADVPDAVGRTAYRIVQESLTNTARHGAASTATVHIDYRPGALAIRVDDDGAARPGVTPVPGVGLQGMRERVTALGGRLRAEPRREGGFTVQAELPLEPVS